MVEVTIDNVTYLGVPRPSWSVVDEYLQMELSAGEGIRCFGARQLDRLGELVNASWVMDGCHISCRLRVSSLGYTWNADLQGVPDERTYPMRIEFNPNKATDRVLWFVANLFQAKKTTRADVAIDYSGTTPSEWVFRRDRVKPKVHFTQDLGGVETFYLGGVTSDRFVRVYDKIAEQIAKRALPANHGLDDLMRVEAVGRQRHVLEPALFDGVRVYSPQIPMDVPLQSRLEMVAWLHEPQVFRRTGWTPRHERRLIKEAKALCDRNLEQLDPHPNEVYRQERDRLLYEVEASAYGQRTRIASIYRNGRPADAAAERPASVEACPS